MPDKEVRKPVQKRAPISGGEAAGVGMQFAVTLVIFAFAGVWLDKRFGTSPLFVLVGVLAGGGAAFYSIYRRLMGKDRRPPGGPEGGT